MIYDEQTGLYDFNAYYRKSNGSLGQIFVEGVTSPNEAIQLVRVGVSTNRVLVSIPGGVV